MGNRVRADDLLVRLRWIQTVWAVALCFITYKCFERQGWSVLTILLTLSSTGSFLTAVRAWVLALSRKKAGKTQA